MKIHLVNANRADRQLVVDQCHDIVDDVEDAKAVVFVTGKFSTRPPWKTDSTLEGRFVIAVGHREAKVTFCPNADPKRQPHLMRVDDFAKALRFIDYVEKSNAEVARTISEASGGSPGELVPNDDGESLLPVEPAT